MNDGFYFAQLTDVHIGKGLNPEEAARNMRWALDELEALSPRPEVILVTGDLVCAGKRWELREYRELAERCTIPSLALPGNHDLWGEPDESAWLDIIGPLCQSVEVSGVRFLMWQDIQRWDPEGGWSALLTGEQREWFEEELAKSEGKPVVVGQHCPLLPVDGDYRGDWRGSNADELLELLSQYNVLALLTGHWHVNREWIAKGIKVVNTGALAGWLWNAVPPHYCFPARPGYRLCHFDGEELRTFWREGSYWSAPAPRREIGDYWWKAGPAVQVGLIRLGGVHTGGPRPEVSRVVVSGRAALEVMAYARENEIEMVECSIERGDWCSIERGDWRPMARTFDGVWSEWAAEIDLAGEGALGERVCIVRARDAEGLLAFDAVPFQVAEDEGARTEARTAAATGAEGMVFELYRGPGRWHQLAER